MDYDIDRIKKCFEFEMENLDRRIIEKNTNTATDSYIKSSMQSKLEELEFMYDLLFKGGEK
jgi:hypothetical protein